MGCVACVACSMSYVLASRCPSRAARPSADCGRPGRGRKLDLRSGGRLQPELDSSKLMFRLFRVTHGFAFWDSYDSFAYFAYFAYFDSELPCFLVRVAISCNCAGKAAVVPPPPWLAPQPFGTG